LTSRVVFSLLLLIGLPSSAQEVIVLYADSGLGPLNPYIQGFLHGKDNEGNLDPTAVETLSPRSWRLSKAATYNIAESFPVSITFVLSDSYAWSQGGYPNAKPWLDWDGYEDYVRGQLQSVYFFYPDNPPEFFDVWNEPDLGYFWSGSYSQLLELYSHCATAVWSVNPNAKLVGPSIARYNENSSGVDNIVQFLEDLDTEYEIRLDAVSWHENESGVLGSDRPELILEHANSIRSRLLEAFGPGYMPELHVNEYSGRYVHLSPGYNAGYLHYLLQSEVDCASRSAWTVISPEDPPYGYWSDCWSGLDGMFNWDGYTPQVIYWVYEFLGGMLDKERLQTVLPNPTTVAEAVRSDAEETVMVMAGRYYHGGQPTDLTLFVQDWPYDHDSVHVLAERVPHYPGFFNTSCPITVAMPDGPTEYWEMDVNVAGGTFEVVVDDFKDNDVWLFTLSEASSTSIHSNYTATVSLSASPNPFNSFSVLQYELQSAGHIRLTIHDISGRLIAELVDNFIEAGHHEVTWEGREATGHRLPTGIYQVRLETESGICYRSLALFH
jgi:hypothetical protein